MNLLTLQIFVFVLCFLIGLVASADDTSVSESTSIRVGPMPVVIPSPETLAERPTRVEPITQPKRCDDPEIKPIWNAIRRDKEVRRALDNGISPASCRDMFELGYFDLNRDGKKEIFARATGIPFCGAVGNCDLFVLQRTRKGLRILLHADDYIDSAAMGKQLLKRRTNGYLDLVALGHFSVSETSYTTYKFNGRKYVEAGCKYEVPKYDERGNLGWEFVSCSEFFRRLERELGRR